LITILIVPPLGDLGDENLEGGNPKKTITTISAVKVKKEKIFVP